MTLTSIISPLSSWFSRWQCITKSPVYSSNRVRIDENAGLDDALLGAHGRHRRIGVVDAEHVRAGAQPGGRVVVFDHLEVVDVDVDRVLVVVVLVNLHSSTEFSRGWISGTLGNAPLSNA